MVSFECPGATLPEASGRCWTADVSQGQLVIEAATRPSSRKFDYRTGCWTGSRANVAPKPLFQRMVSRRLAVVKLGLSKV